MSVNVIKLNRVSVRDFSLDNERECSQLSSNLQKELASMVEKILVPFKEQLRSSTVMLTVEGSKVYAHMNEGERILLFSDLGIAKELSELIYRVNFYAEHAEIGTYAKKPHDTSTPSTYPAVEVLKNSKSEKIDFSKLSCWAYLGIPIAFLMVLSGFTNLLPLLDIKVDAVARGVFDGADVAISCFLLYELRKSQKSAKKVGDKDSQVAASRALIQTSVSTGLTSTLFVRNWILPAAGAHRTAAAMDPVLGLIGGSLQALGFYSNIKTIFKQSDFYYKIDQFYKNKSLDEKQRILGTIKHLSSLTALTEQEKIACRQAVVEAAPDVPSADLERLVAEKEDEAIQLKLLRLEKTVSSLTLVRLVRKIDKNLIDRVRAHDPEALNEARTLIEGIRFENREFLVRSVAKAALQMISVTLFILSYVIPGGRTFSTLLFVSNVVTTSVPIASTMYYDIWKSYRDKKKQAEEDDYWREHGGSKNPFESGSVSEHNAQRSVSQNHLSALDIPLNPPKQIFQHTA